MEEILGGLTKAFGGIVSSLDDLARNFLDNFSLLVFDDFLLDGDFFDHFSVLVLDDFFFVGHVVDSTVALMIGGLPLTTSPSLKLELTMRPTSLVVRALGAEVEEKLLLGLEETDRWTSAAI